MAEVDMHALHSYRLLDVNVQVGQGLHYSITHPQGSAVDQPFLPDDQVLGRILFYHGKVGQKIPEGIPLQLLLVVVLLPPSSKGRGGKGHHGSLDQQNKESHNQWIGQNAKFAQKR
jgi:hypothetical protein